MHLDSDGDTTLAVADASVRIVPVSATSTSSFGARSQVCCEPTGVGSGARCGPPTHAPDPSDRARLRVVPGSPSGCSFPAFGGRTTVFRALVMCAARAASRRLQGAPDWRRRRRFRAHHRPPDPRNDRASRRRGEAASTRVAAPRDPPAVPRAPGRRALRPLPRVPPPECHPQPRDRASGDDERRPSRMRSCRPPESAGYTGTSRRGVASTTSCVRERAPPGCVRRGGSNRTWPSRPIRSSSTTAVASGLRPLNVPTARLASIWRVGGMAMWAGASDPDVSGH